MTKGDFVFVAAMSCFCVAVLIHKILDWRKLVKENKKRDQEERAQIGKCKCKVTCDRCGGDKDA